MKYCSPSLSFFFPFIIVNIVLIYIYLLQLLLCRDSRYEIANFDDKLAAVISKLKANLTRSRKKIG